MKAQQSKQAKLGLGNRSGPESQMAPCPETLGPNQAAPEGWNPYFGDPGVFHCDFRGILEDVEPSPDRPMNECFYDDAGTLVDETHPYSQCGGTPDYYSGKTDPFDHAVRDPGGIVAEGGPALIESTKHWIHERSTDEKAERGERGWKPAMGNAIGDGFADLAGLPGGQASGGHCEDADAHQAKLDAAKWYTPWNWID